MKNGSCLYCRKLNPNKRVNAGKAYYCCRECEESYKKAKKMNKQK